MRYVSDKFNKARKAKGLQPLRRLELCAQRDSNEKSFFISFVLS